VPATFKIAKLNIYQISDFLLILGTKYIQRANKQITIICLSKTIKMKEKKK